ncbi:MAG: DUF4065 domain-containing protein [Deltaproteobacteria bacterium]|jgi:uncharacterized phage-associated protein|nr:DUF4065 domain-containing protein [Deltaproteobacteria bacterium]
MAEIVALNSAAAVVNWFIDKNRTDGVDLTRLKIQKLPCFAQGWRLAHFDAPLFEDNIHAWKYGPVVETIYQALKRHEKEEIIKDYLPVYEFVNGAYFNTRSKLNFPTDRSEEFLLAYWDQYSPVDAWRLVSGSHEKNSPWDQVVSSPAYDKRANSLTPLKIIRSYFKSPLVGMKAYA